MIWGAISRRRSFDIIFVEATMRAVDCKKKLGSISCRSSESWFDSAVRTGEKLDMMEFFANPISPVWRDLSTVFFMKLSTAGFLGYFSLSMDDHVDLTCEHSSYDGVVLGRTSSRRWDFACRDVELEIIYSDSCANSSTVLFEALHRKVLMSRSPSSVLFARVCFAKFFENRRTYLVSELRKMISLIKWSSLSQAHLERYTISPMKQTLS